MRSTLPLGALFAIGCGRIGFAERGAPADAAAPLVDAAPATATLLAHTIINGQVATLKTAPLDTRGATLIVVAECTWSTGAPLTPTDSAGNAWVAIPPAGANQAPANIGVFYALAPTTSPAHVFVDPGNDYLSVAVLAFAGPAHLDNAASGTGPVPFATGTALVTEPDELVVAFACSGESVATAIAIDSGFTLVDQVLNGNSGAPEDMASAFRVVPTTGTVGPAWTFTGDTKVTGTLAAFVR